MKSQNVLPGNAGHHGVHFYSDPARLCASVADFLGDGIAAQQPVVVIATPAHRKQIQSSLCERRFDVEMLCDTGSVTFLDARDTLDRFMVNGVPNGPKFRQAVGEVLSRVGGRSEGAVRAYGEMVDVLWREGKPEAAIQLELLWNELAKTHAFSLLCGYAMGHFYKEASRDDVCAVHTQVHP